MRVGNAEVLNSKKIKNILRLLHEQWGYDKKLDCGFLQKENDVFLVTRDIDKINLAQLNVNSTGLYFGELRNEQLRLSIEGSQIIGKAAKKNVMELDEQQLQQWLRGEDIELNDDASNEVFVLISHKNDFFGCGRIKAGKLLNFVPKSRRIK